MLNWLKNNGNTLDKNTFNITAHHGSLEKMNWLKENGCPQDERTFAFAINHGSLESTKWLKENGYPKLNRYDTNEGWHDETITAWFKTIGYRRSENAFIKIQ